MFAVLPAGITVDTAVATPLTMSVTGVDPLYVFDLTRILMFWIVPARGDR
jgi:hypothetical protein